MEDTRPLCINLYGGPGTGKSTVAALVFGLLKSHGVNAELVTEFAKDLTWEGRYKTLKNQQYIWSKQYHRLWRVRDQVDVIITDSPLLNSLVYIGTGSKLFNERVKESSEEFYNINFLLERKKKYNPAGRVQTEDKAKRLDIKIRRMLEHNKVNFTEEPADYTGANNITHNILRRLGVKREIYLEKLHSLHDWKEGDPIYVANNVGICNGIINDSL